MSYEFKMQGVGNGKRSRLYKKTKRASMNKIDATHLPMRVQSDKGSYWGQTSRGSVHISYSKLRKSSTYKNWSINDYYYYVVKISDIEAYKKEKYKL